MYFLRQIILDTKVNPKKIPKIPENMICLETPERSSETEKGGVLWITDQGQRAQELLRQGYPVLAWLHEHNRDQNFSGVRYACENLEELDWDYMEKVYRRYMGIPWDILTTDRCLVRETRAEDLDALYEIYAEPSVTQYTEGLYPQREQEEAYLKDYTENMYYFYNYGVWTICDKTTGQVSGRVGFPTAKVTRIRSWASSSVSRGSGRDMRRKCVRHCWNTGKKNWDLSRYRCW